MEPSGASFALPHERNNCSDSQSLITLVKSRFCVAAYLQEVHIPRFSFLSQQSRYILTSTLLSGFVPTEAIFYRSYSFLALLLPPSYSYSKPHASFDTDLKSLVSTYNTPT
jgi:hypothetical protein